MAVRVERSGPVTTVVLDRPGVRNAVDPETAAALVRACGEFDADPEARVAVLWGDHGTFCAGADLKAISRGDAPRIRLDGDGPLGPTRMVLSKPVIAAISGYAVAGGLELALWCDLRVMEEDAVLGVFCRRWGVPLADGGTVRLPRLIGLSRALDMILTGRPVGAREALEIGLVNRVVPRGAARREAEALARDIARFPQACMRNDRRSAHEQVHLPLREALANEARLALETARSGEALEGALRFAAGEGRHGSFDLASAPARRRTARRPTPWENLSGGARFRAIQEVNMVYKLIDLVGVSSKDYSAAVAEAVKEASKTIRGIERVTVERLEATVANNRITEYRAYVKVVFKIER